MEFFIDPFDFVSRVSYTLGASGQSCVKRSEKLTEKDLRELKNKGDDMGETVEKLWNLSEDELERKRIEDAEMARRILESQKAYLYEEGMEKKGEKRG